MTAPPPQDRLYLFMNMKTSDFTVKILVSLFSFSDCFILIFIRALLFSWFIFFKKKIKLKCIS